MASNFLTPEARRENALALAAAVGLGVEEASRALDLTVLITVDHQDFGAQKLATELRELLQRTVLSVALERGEADPSVEIIIGGASARTAAKSVFVYVGPAVAQITTEPLAVGSTASIPGIFLLLTACYASAATLKRALGDALPLHVPDPMVISFSDFEVGDEQFRRPLDLGRAYLAGAGAIGNGFLWAARHVNFRGELHVVDDDIVSPGNLNRQIWFDTQSIGNAKPVELCRRAQIFFPELKLVPRLDRLQNLEEKCEGPWLARLISAVDSRRARGELQREFPGEVFDAPTTDIREVVLHSHRQPTAGACLSCIYMPDDEEFSREQHIAEHFGVSVAEVRSERISRAASLAIAGRFTGLRPTETEGTSYDTLFKRLCAESALRTVDGRRIVAPFAFVSALAGTILTLDIVRRLSASDHTADSNYWRVSAWHPPIARRRILRPREVACDFCGVPLLSEINARLWGAG